MAKLNECKNVFRLYAEDQRNPGIRSEQDWAYQDTFLPSIAPEGSLARHLARVLFMVPMKGEPINSGIRKQLRADFTECYRLIQTDELELIEASLVWLIAKAWRKYMRWAEPKGYFGTNPEPFIDDELKVQRRIEKDLGIHIE